MAKACTDEVFTKTHEAFWVAAKAKCGRARPGQSAAAAEIRQVHADHHGAPGIHAELRSRGW